MKPSNLKTRIVLDSGDPQETREALELLGFLDGQTTNPSLIANNPQTAGKKFSKNEILDFYKKVVQEISGLIPAGSVSVEVYADPSTTATDMIEQGKAFNEWIPNAHIKYPTTSAGLQAAEFSVSQRMRINLTLCFSQEQAAAVYEATKGAQKGEVFVSPFVGRLDDRGENGMDLIRNIINMYDSGDDHVEVLTASVRNLEHLLYAVALGSDIVTAPLKILREWVEQGLRIPDQDYRYQPLNLRDILPRPVELGRPWGEYGVKHELTDVGIAKFSSDWNNLII